jgi:hypothetical protein
MAQRQKYILKKKTEELLDKRLCNSIKRQNLQIMGIKEGKEVQAKTIHNIVNKMIAENFPNLEKEMPIQVQEATRTSNRHDQNRTSTQHVIVNTISTENKERILKYVRKKNQIQR